MHRSPTRILLSTLLLTLLAPISPVTVASQLSASTSPAEPAGVLSDSPGREDIFSSHVTQYDIQEETLPQSGLDSIVEEELEGDSDSASLDAGLVKRAPKAILNNTPVLDGLRTGGILNYVFAHSINKRDFDEAEEHDEIIDYDDEWDDENTLDAADLELRKRQSGNGGNNGGGGGKQRTVYITLNTCTLPDFTRKADRQKPPQLTLYVSTSAQEKEPGPKSNPSEVRSRTMVEGFLNFTVRTQNDLYLGVAADRVPVHDNGIWTYNIAASVDKPYHSYIDSSLNLFMIDSDRNAALLITRNLSTATPSGQETKDWLAGGPPLSIFVQEENNTAIHGLHRSYCGLAMRSTFPGYEVDPSSIGMETGLTTYSGSSLEQQFYIPNLNATSKYFGILARPSKSGVTVPGGGGAVYASMTFHTKLQANCAVIYNLTFCSSIAYAVPANPATYPDLPSLAALYDETTAEKYQNFNYSLQQIPCNTTATAQYSLNKTCDDCAAAYKKWLCAVSIPRCADWVPHPTAHGKPFLQPRNAAQAPIASTPDIDPVTDQHVLSWLSTNSSRNNHTIAGKIQPGPYAEILPCEDLCFEIVRSCPASFGFGCPYKGRGLESGYGVRNLDVNGGVSCSEPGAVFGLSAGVTVGVRIGLVFTCAATAAFWAL